MSDSAVFCFKCGFDNRNNASTLEVKDDAEAKPHHKNHNESIEKSESPVSSESPSETSSAESQNDVIKNHYQQLSNQRLERLL